MEFGRGRVVEIRRRVEIPAQHLQRGVERYGARSVAGKDRCGTGTEERDALAGRISDTREADDGVVALAPRELEEHGAIDLRKFRGSDDFASTDIGLEQAFEEMRSRDAPLAPPVSEHDG